MERLEEDVKRLAEAGLQLKKDKCQFMVPSVQYLRVVIDAEGIHPTTDKVN